MNPFRKHIAIAIDGGGIRGVIPTRALMHLESALSLPVQHIFRLAAGTSTGAIIAAGIAAGMTAREMCQLYIDLGPLIFKKTWRHWLWPLTRYRYPNRPLISSLERLLGDRIMGDFWDADLPTDVVITAFDLKENRSLFIKPWKDEYREWPVARAVLASCTVPTYFPVLDGRYVDGGVGSYANPCYLAAYELRYCLGWDLSETTLISLGTGRSPHHFEPQQANRLWPWEWIEPGLGAFSQSADDQQVHLVETFFPELDFRRFQVDLRQPIAMDDVGMVPRLAVYGDELGRMILNDQVDRSQGVLPKRVL
ncbi:MAG: patatin-like phospholipase family protein [Anaerolineaceae bacterium]|nr:patatin-like phospholipase family protein [Anaerolineaceae bacterium]